LIDSITFSRLPSYCSYFFCQSGADRFLSLMGETQNQNSTTFIRGLVSSGFFLSFIAVV
jgi:hypothetical protein